MTARVLTADEAAADRQAAIDKVKRVAPSAYVVPRIPMPILPAFYHERIAACGDCPHYNDDINTGEPRNPPCMLNKSLTTCGWKSAARTMDYKHPAADCLWHNLEVTQ